MIDFLNIQTIYPKNVKPLPLTREVLTEKCLAPDIGTHQHDLWLIKAILNPQNYVYFINPFNASVEKRMIFEATTRMVYFYDSKNPTSSLSLSIPL